MNYKEMIKQAIADGKSSETAMWSSVDHVEELLELLKESHPDEYWHFMRKAHESLYGRHYNKEYAEYDVSQLYSTDKEGREKKGAHWTLQELLKATAGKTFPKGVTEYDVYVAYNICASDFCKDFSDEDILEIAYVFFFNDEDWSPSGCSTKVWDYVCAKHRANKK